MPYSLENGHNNPTWATEIVEMGEKAFEKDILKKGVKEK
jgi:hypothetical protein